MIRLLIACAVAYSLLPEIKATPNAKPSETTQQNTLTAQDTLSAVQSTVSDVMRFCERNVETCLTAQALASEAKQKAIQTLNALGKTENNDIQNDIEVQLDEETTASTPQ